MNGTGTELQNVNPAKNHNKFWRCLVNGSTVITHYGRIGAKGSTTVKHFSSNEDAREYASRLAEDKKYKGGYRPIRQDRPFPVDGSLIQKAKSSTRSGRSTGFGGTDPDATWKVISAWETWMEYTNGMSDVDVDALLMSENTPDEVLAIAVHDERAGTRALVTVAGQSEVPRETRAVAFLRVQGG